MCGISLVFIFVLDDLEVDREVNNVVEIMYHVLRKYLLGRPHREGD